MTQFKQSFCVMMVLCLMFSGCESFKKKFVRQKKKDQTLNEEALPILETVDYPDPSYSSPELYRKHYALWQVWFKDLLVALDEPTSSPKKEIYNLEQTMTHLEILSGLLTDTKQSALKNMIAEFDRLEEPIRKASGRSQRVSIKSQLESLGKKIRLQYKFKSIENDLINSIPVLDQSL